VAIDLVIDHVVVAGAGLALVGLLGAAGGAGIGVGRRRRLLVRRGVGQGAGDAPGHLVGAAVGRTLLEAAHRRLVGRLVGAIAFGGLFAAGEVDLRGHLDAHIVGAEQGEKN